MKVIFKQDVPGQGKKGDVKDVNDGYARNYLIAKGFVVEATGGGLAEIQRQKEAVAAKLAAEKAAAKELAEKLKSAAVTVSVKSGENGKIFGSVTGKEIADELKKQGYNIDKKQLVIDGVIKHTGEYQIEIKVYPEITAKVKLVVVGA